MTTHATTRDRLEALVATLETNPAYAEVTAALGHGKEASVDGAWGSSCALAAALLARAPEAGVPDGVLRRALEDRPHVHGAHAEGRLSVPQRSPAHAASP